MLDEELLIFNWLNNQIFPTVDEHGLETSINELNYLVEIIPSSLNDCEAEKAILIQWLDRGSLDARYKKFLSKNEVVVDNTLLRNISDRPVIAFLNNSTRTDKTDLIRSVYFLVCLKLVLLENHDSRIKRTLDVCRLLTTNNRNFLIQFMPDFNEISSLNGLLNYFEGLNKSNLFELWNGNNDKSLEKFISKARKKPHKDERNREWSDEDLCNHRLSKYLYDFSFPLEEVVTQRDGIKRKTKQAEKTITSSFYKDETTGNTIKTLSFVTEIDDQSSGFEVNERRDDEGKAIEQVNLAKPTNYYKDIVRAEQQVNSRRLRSMNQVTDVNIAHIDEIILLLEEVLQTLSKLDITEFKKSLDSGEKISITDILQYQTALYLLMLLLTGSEDIILSSDFNLKHNVFVYKIMFQPTRSKIKEDWNHSICADNQEYLFGFMPKIIGYISLNITESINDKYFTSIQKNAVEVLKHLNKRHHTRLTLHRVQTYLSHYLANQGYDHALIDVLTNKPVHQLSSLPYFNVSQLDLYYCQSDFNEHLFNKYIESKRSSLNETEAKIFFELPDDKEINYWEKQTGTALAIDENTLEAIVTEHVLKIQNEISLKNPNQLDTIVHLHNSFTDYLYIMLSISTGHRPVTEPFGRLNQIDTRTGKYFISDKENHKDSTGRFIYLPELACQQIQIFEHYLNSLVSLFGRLDDPIGNILSDIITSKSGLISYLELSDIDDKNVVSSIKINTTYIHNRLSKIVNLPLNWPRHFIRSYKHMYDGIYSLRYQGADTPFSYDTIGSFMGHADELGYDFINRYSSMKSKELRRLAVRINEILIRSGFIAIDLELNK